MRDRKAPPPPENSAKQRQRSERLAAALRANLARRKAVKRLRAPTAGGKEAE
ncbi:MAG: hypothetical protein U1E59_16835 [Amaricoccus sp.]